MSNDLTIGTRVKHPAYGNGIILDNAMEKAYCVVFKNHGEKFIEKKSEIDTFLLSGQVVYFDTATSSSQPIPFASIMVKGTVYGVTADEEGNFKLGYSASDTSITILINSVGFEPYELANISLNDNKAIDLGVIKMELGKWELIEFVVSRKRNIFSRFWRMITKPFRKM